MMKHVNIGEQLVNKAEPCEGSRFRLNNFLLEALSCLITMDMRVNPYWECQGPLKIIDSIFIL